MTQAAIKIENNFDSHSEENSNWSLRIEFDPQQGKVNIYDWHGNGQSMTSYLRQTLFLGSANHANFADLDELVEFLESEDTQETLRLIADGHEVEWDGSNHVGRLTDEAQSLLEQLDEKITEVLNRLPSFWSADEWFNGVDVVKEMIRDEADNIESYASDEAHKASPDIRLDEEEVARYLTRKLEQAAEGDDLDRANYARRLLDQPLLTTLWSEWEAYDEDKSEGVAFTDHTLDGVVYTLVDDKSQCWLADERELSAAMEKLREAPAANVNERGNWWYDRLCEEVRHRPEAVEAFEAQHGPRNWP